MCSALSALTLNPVVTRMLSATEGKDMTGVAIRDTMVNNAVSHEDSKRDKYHGAEMCRNLWFTTAVWGFGVQACNAIYDKAAAALGRPLANANVGMMTQPGFAESVEQWAAQAAQSSSKVVQKAGQEVAGVLQAGGQKIAPELAAAHYDKLGVGKFLFSGVLPAVIVGPVFPPINRHITKVLMARDMAATKDIPFSEAMEQIQAAHDKAKAEKAAKHPHHNNQLGLGLLAGATGAGAAVAGAMAGPQAKELMTSAVRTLNQNETLTNLLGVDSVITGGRIQSGDTPAEKMEWLIQEALLIGMAYFGAPWLNDKLKDSLGQVSPDLAPYAGMKFETLQKLHNQYGKQNGEGLAAFQQDMKQAATDLGLSLEGKTGQAAAEELLSKKGELAQAIQAKLAPGAYEPGKNLIVDLVVEAGHMPVLKEGLGDAISRQGIAGLWNRHVIGFNPTQQATTANALVEPKLNFLQGMKQAVGLHDGDSGVLKALSNGEKVGNAENLEGLVHGLWDLSEKVGKTVSTETLEKTLSHTSLLKAGALGVALGANYAILGKVSPMLRHASTKHMTGSDGVDWLKVNDQAPQGCSPVEDKNPFSLKGAAGTAAVSNNMGVASDLQVNRVTTPYKPPFIGNNNGLAVGSNRASFTPVNPYMLGALHQ